MRLLASSASRARRRAYAVAALLGLASSPAGAQAPWTLSVRADNDAFDFWRPPAERSDDEFTNGVQLIFESARAPWWGRRLARGLAPCTGFEAPYQKCLSTAITLSQEIYTPRRDREPYERPDWEDERPYAGWLYLGGTARVANDRSQRIVELVAGVTGPPSLARFTQTVAHTLSGVYTTPPHGWDTQVGFEPGVRLTIEERWLLGTARAGASRVFDVAPYAGMSLGNIHTGGAAGVRARFGWNMSHPWRAAAAGARPPLELFALAGARGEYVARHFSLDGELFGPERRVERIPWVSEYELGAGIRHRSIIAVYRAFTRGREYRTGPRGHAVGSLLVGFEMEAAPRPRPGRPVRDDECDAANDSCR